MNDKYVIKDIKVAIQNKDYPEVTAWNRLEGRPRTNNFDRALKAEVRDALWMLTRQWQMGEFNGDDAGSPVFAKLHIATTQLTRYQPEGHTTQPFEDGVPLEAHVERQPIPFTQYQWVTENELAKSIEQDISLDVRLLMGRQWLKLIKDIGNYSKVFIDKYSFQLPKSTDSNHAYLCAHPEVWATFAAVAGRRMDGAKLYFYLTGAEGRQPYDGINSITNNQHKIAMEACASKFIAWFEKLFYQPPNPDEDAWLPDRLEYQFAVSAPEGDGEKVLSAEEYYHGRLDWYNFDIDLGSSELGGDANTTDPRGTITRTFIPTQIVFDGMPNTRWWTFEDRRTNFGDIKPDTTDIDKMLVPEFGLVYANDWFLVPQTLPVGSIARIKGLAVTNVFGERFWIEAAGNGADDAWQRWSMFTLNSKGNMGEPADTSLLLLPTVPKTQEGKPVEQVVFIRDELANMVWGIEKIIPLAIGDSKPGAEAAMETLKFYEKLLEDLIEQLKEEKSVLEAKITRTSDEEKRLEEIRDLLQLAAPATYNAAIRYQIMNTVPEHWIPFIPVHIKDDNREIQLQRAAILRILEGDTNSPQKIRPRTSLLHEGMNQSSLTAYYVHEEEVPRAGIQVMQSFQRTRWRDGRVWVWLGVQKQTGRGEGSSRLAFDQIVHVEK